MRVVLVDDARASSASCACCVATRFAFAFMFMFVVETLRLWISVDEEAILDFSDSSEALD